MFSEDSVRKRINQILKMKDVSVNELSGGDLNLKQRLYTQLTYNKKLSADTILVVLNKFPDVSADWLFKGIGNAVAEENSLMFDENNEQSDIDSNIEQSIEYLANRISRLEAAVFKI